MLKRRLKNLKLFRRKRSSDLLDVAVYIVNEHEYSGKIHEYRWMHLKCIQAGFNIPRDTVYQLLRILDREGVKARKRRRLKRRTYYSLRPNYLWHVDSYDKLKPYGIAINTCIDGFSRNIIWLEANTTNNDPKVIANYFISALKRTGTENAYLEQIQIFIWRNHDDKLAGEISFLYGTSTHNQRIEWFWGLLREELGQFFMDLFSELRQDGNALFSGDFLDRSLI